MFGISETELVIILVFAFLLFGPDKMPGIGRTVGRALRQFRDASNGFTEVVQTNIMDPAAEELKKSPKQRHAEEAASTASASSQGAPSEAQGQDGMEEPQHETFAQRKARLEAERKAKAAAQEDAAAAPAADAYYDDEDADSDADISPVGAPSPETAQPAEASESTAVEPQSAPVAGVVTADEQPEQLEPTTAADLYALGERHSARRRAREAAKVEAENAAEPASDVQSGEEDGSTEA